MKAKLWYMVTDNGDGSAGVQFFQTQAAAERAEEKLIEDVGHNFAEDTVGHVELEFDPTRGICLLQEKWNSKTKDFVQKSLPLFD